MKKCAIIAFSLVLTVTLLTGCGCTAQDSGMSTMPSTEQTILPTNIPETTVPTEKATEPMTMPATDPTDEAGTEETGGMNGETQEGSTAETGDSSRSRMR